MKSKRTRWLLLVLVLLCSLAALTWMGIKGGSGDWHSVTCRVVSSRIQRRAAEGIPSASAAVVYDGEYGLSYSVDGHEHIVWAYSGWSDTNGDLLRTKLEPLPEQCSYDVRYNPQNPSEAVAHRR